MKLLTILTILFLVTTTQAQTPDNDALFGTFNVRNDAARICLATAGPSGATWCLSSMAFEWNNGPPGEETYLNHTAGFGYNVDFNGNKIVPGLVNYTLSSEAKFRNGNAGEPGHFMTEFHLNWESPDGSIKVRPLGADVQYNSGDFNLAVHGTIRFFRNASNGNGMWGLWHDDGALDLSHAPNGRIAFKNNHTALLWGNAASSNSVAPLFVDNRDRVVVGGGQQETVINSAKLVYTHPQCGAIADSDGSEMGNARVLNAILACLRANQFLPQSTNPKVVQDLPVCVGDATVQAKSAPAKAKLRRARIQR